LFGVVFLVSKSLIPSTELLKQCIDYIDGRAEIEVSGNVTKENIERIKGLGVNYVSSGGGL